jgi:capsular exopolysaccharide synthesis family protein
MSRVSDAVRLAAIRADAVEARESRTDAVELRQSQSLSRFEIPTETVEVHAEIRLVAHTDPLGPTADRLRYLRLRLNQLWDAEKLRRLLITSPQPHDGKSTFALNLAITLSEEGRRSVLLIEGDLHRPMVSEYLDLARRPGVAECLLCNTDPYSFIRRIEPLGFHFLPAGNTRGNATELLHTAALRKMIETLTPRFDWILIDSPPVAPLTDTLYLKQCADATLLIARAGQTLVRAVDEAVNLISRKHVLAIILNGVEDIDGIYKKYYKAYGKLPSV